jgi:uncharacterized protein (TIGR03435 family)
VKGLTRKEGAFERAFLRVVLRLCAVWVGLTCFTAGFAVGQGSPPPSMANDAKPTFEVATIKPSQPDERRLFFVNGTRLQTTGTSVVDLMTFAYSVHQAQVSAEPAWIRTDRYDVVMQPDLAGRASTAQMRVIMQQLLADRFHLQVHHASKELDVYAIVPSKRGPHLTPTTPEESTENTAVGGSAPGMMEARNATVAEFANLMNRYMQLEWPVVDDTHIPGKFDFKITWIPDTLQPGATPPPPARNDSPPAPDLFAAMDQQLGLELKARREPTDVLVIDRVEKPTEN